MDGDELLRVLRDLGIPEAQVALAIVQLCRRLGGYQQLLDQAVNRGTGPQCGKCGERQLRRAGGFDPEHTWLACGNCGHLQMGELDRGPGLQQLLQAEGIDEDDQPYFWELT